MSYHVKSLHIYPIKSLQGINLTSAKLVEYGFQYDRQWMLVDADNQFITQRTLPLMATLSTKIEHNLLVVYTQKSQIKIDLNKDLSPDIEVTVWNDTVQACTESDEINHWFSQQLGIPCQLVKLAKDNLRQVDTVFAHNNESVGFADAFPLLVVSQSSIELLNSKLDNPIDMNRFRPNIVIAGLTPHEEDKLSSLIINGIEIKLVKPCDRCTVPSVDQKTGEKRGDVLRALIKYRQFNKNIYFGMNGLQQSIGTISVDQIVQVID